MKRTSAAGGVGVPVTDQPRPSALTLPSLFWLAASARRSTASMPLERRSYDGEFRVQPQLGPRRIVRRLINFYTGDRTCRHGEEGPRRFNVPVNEQEGSTCLLVQLLHC